MAGPLQIFPMTFADLDEVMRIEEVSFPRPWTRNHFEGELKNPMAFMFVGKVPQGETYVLVSYMVFWRVHDEVHVLDIAVHPDYRRQGIGRAMMNFAMANMKEMGASSVYLEVRKSNVAAQELYKDLGFNVIGERKGYYENGENAIVMAMEFVKRW